MYLTKGLESSVGLVGAISKQGQGFGFVSYTQAGNSRKSRETAEQAIPKWFTGSDLDTGEM